MATGGEDEHPGGARKKWKFWERKKKGDKESLLGASSTDSETLAQTLYAKMGTARELIHGPQFNNAYHRLRNNIDASPAGDLVYVPLNPTMSKMDQYGDKLRDDMWELDSAIMNEDVTMAELQRLEPKVDRFVQECRYYNSIMQAINNHRFSIEEMFFERQWFESNRPQEIPDRSVYEFTYIAHPGTMKKDMDQKLGEYGEVAWVISREFMKIYRALENSPPFPDKQRLIQELVDIKDRFTQSDAEIEELENAIDNLPQEEIECSTEIMRIVSIFCKILGRAYQWRVRMYEINQIVEQLQAPPPLPTSPPPGPTIKRSRSGAFSENLPLPDSSEEEELVVGGPPTAGFSQMSLGSTTSQPLPPRRGLQVRPSGRGQFGLSPIPEAFEGTSSGTRPRTPSPRRSHRSSILSPISGPGYQPLGSSERRRFELSPTFARSLPSSSGSSRPRTPSPDLYTSPKPRRRADSGLQFQLSGSQSQSSAGSLSPEEFMLPPDVTPVPETGGLRIPGRKTPPSSPGGSSRRRLSFSD